MTPTTTRTCSSPPPSCTILDSVSARQARLVSRSRAPIWLLLVLRRHGVAERDIDRVWEAIALHASLGIAHRRGLLTSLTHKGVFIDAGRITDGVADRLRQEVLNAYPRPAGDRSIADAIVAHATRSDAAAPPGSLAFELLRQHREAERARVGRQQST